MGELVEKRIFIQLPAAAMTSGDAANMVFSPIQLWDDDEFGENIMHTLVHAEVFLDREPRFDSSSYPLSRQIATFSIQDTIPFASAIGSAATSETPPYPDRDTVLWMEVHNHENALGTVAQSTVDVFPTEELGFTPTLRTPAQYIYPTISYAMLGPETNSPEINAVFYMVFERTTINPKDWAVQWINHRQNQLYDYMEIAGKLQTAQISSEFSSIIDGGIRDRMNVASVFTHNDDAVTMLTQAGYVAQFQDVHTMSTQTGPLGLTIDPDNWGRMTDGLPSTFWDYEKVPIRYDAATNQKVMVSQ